MNEPAQFAQEIKDLLGRVDATIRALPETTPGRTALCCLEDMLQRAATAAEVAAARVRPAL